jgi:hypothetical protein
MMDPNRMSPGDRARFLEKWQELGGTRGMMENWQNKEDAKYRDSERRRNEHNKAVAKKAAFWVPFGAVLGGILSVLAFVFLPSVKESYEWFVVAAIASVIWAFLWGWANEFTPSGIFSPGGCGTFFAVMLVACVCLWFVCSVPVIASIAICIALGAIYGANATSLILEIIFG